MRKGTGEGRTRADHPAVAAQLVAAVSRARQVRDLAELIGTSALTETDVSYLTFSKTFNAVLVDQGSSESRVLDDTLARAWQVASVLPRRELAMIPADDVAAHYVGDEGTTESDHVVPEVSDSESRREDDA